MRSEQAEPQWSRAPHRALRAGSGARGVTSTSPSADRGQGGPV